MTQNTLPNFSQLNAKLAVDNQRVNQWIDGLVEHIDNLVDATTRSDWMEVKRLSEYIARASAIYGFPLLAENADRCPTRNAPGCSGDNQATDACPHNDFGGNAGTGVTRANQVLTNAGCQL